MDDIKIVHRDPTTGRLTIGVKVPPVLATGTEKLVQNFVLMLMNSPGRDVEDPKDGGALPSLIGQLNVDPDDPAAVMADVNLALDRVKRQIIKYQTDMAYDDPTSKLRDVQVTGIAQGISIDSLDLKIRLVSEAGVPTDIVV